MTVLDADKAQTPVSDYFALLERGETVVLYRDDKPFAELRRIEGAGVQRPIGLAKGEFIVPDNIVDPMSDEELQEWGLID